MVIDFFAKEKHFEAHLAPIAAKLEEAGLDVNWVRKAQKSTSNATFAVVAAAGDLVRANDARRLVFFCEHGAGQTYLATRHSSYAGGTGRENVCAFVSPGPHVDRANKKYYPKVPSIKAGVPKLDHLHKKLSSAPAEPPAIPKVCFSFHWDCEVCPETRSGFEHFKHAILKAKKTGEFDILVHCHPRAVSMCLPFYEQYKLNYIEDFDTVLKEADIYVCDNSSTIFEFASMGKPVVLLNPPWYRKHIYHGLRFWEYATIGEQAHDDEEVIQALRRSVHDTKEKRDSRLQMIRQVYHAIDGKAADRAALGIVKFIEEFIQMKEEGHELKVKRFSMGPFGFVDQGQTITIFPDYAVVYDHLGRMQRKMAFPYAVAPEKRIREILTKAPRNYEPVEPEKAPPEEVDPLDIDYATNISLADEFTPKEKVLSAEELYLVKAIQEGKSKTAAVYKSETEFKVAALQRAWHRLESEGIIVKDSETQKWTVKTWGL